MARASQKNPFVGVNYIPDNVRMEEPPTWFLQRVYDFDNMLLMLPSRVRPFYYVMARRKQFTKGLTDAAIDDTLTDSDTKMCARYGCVPVCLMFKHGPVWDADKILLKLASRDIWAMGGADKVADMLEEQEAAEKAKTRAELRDRLYHASGDAYRSYKIRTGQAVAGSGAQSGRRISKQTPSGSTAGSGAMFVRDVA